MKRLVVCSDGLWSGSRGAGQSNLDLLVSAIAPSTANGTIQITLQDPFSGQARTGQPHLQDSVCWLYRQLAHNFAPGDELWFFGYSRGAFVVRSLAGLIRNTGLLKKHQLNHLPEAWHIYRTTWGADARNATVFRDARCQRVSVKFLGVLDTVGSNGIPGNDSENCGFHDNVLSSAVENACHALAIDENRGELSPCLWKTAPDRSRTEQCWFAGSHRDIGGMGREMALANLSLDWIALRASALGLELDRGFLATAMAQRLPSPQASHSAGNVSLPKSTGFSRAIGACNHDETLHSSAEQLFLRNQGYRPSNLKRFLARDEQIQLPL